MLSRLDSVRLGKRQDKSEWSRFDKIMPKEASSIFLIKF